ncbi:MAG: pseudouridine-5'-phosphate glycosidase [Christensenellaceae bacterium]|jgi:pseudouridine-5'-phosphate glycosidase|nr:pseudouridine-5'-phosphate glycosidase [Christensenellaceae bacterium]
MNPSNLHMLFSPEVTQAKAAHKPIVALESTIISHGMPYPQNVDMARTCENIIRENGAVPATCAILSGKLCIGLDNEQLEYFGKAGPSVAKASRRDIARLVATKADGATTVAATMILAKLAGIRVFATGGIGGVHREAETTMDISADLEELARTDVTVVCAGAKSILDLQRTMEYLETKGVPVIGYGTDELPAFYTRTSGIKLDCRMDTPAEIAAAIRADMALELGNGMLVMNPIPEDMSMDAGYISQAIDLAVQEAKQNGIHGKALTPFLLGRIVGVTGGKSLESNIALAYNNAKLAAQIAALI